MNTCPMDPAIECPRWMGPCGANLALDCPDVIESYLDDEEDDEE